MVDDELVGTELAPYYIPPEALRFSARQAWVSEHPDASVTEAMDAIGAIDRRITTGEYRDEATGDRLVWVHEGASAAETRAANEAAQTLAQILADNPVDVDAPRDDHEANRVAIEKAREDANVTPAEMAVHHANQGRGHWEVYDEGDHGEYSAQLTEADIEARVVTKDGGAGTASAAEEDQA